MSLAALCNGDTATIQRVASTDTAGMGSTREYTTANRGSLPTSSTGRLQPTSGFRRDKFGAFDSEIDAVWYTRTDPQCNNRDLLIVAGQKYFVHAQINFDRLGSYFRLDLKNYSRGNQ